MTDDEGAAPDAYPCPCCGHLTLSEPPGSYYICQVCFWEDDPVQLRWPTHRGGANATSLADGQLNYILLGAMEHRFVEHVRPPAESEPVEAGWRPIDLQVDSFELPMHQERSWPTDLTVLYWWRPTFWRRGLR
jgi:hypothetical protein